MNRSIAAITLIVAAWCCCLGEAKPSIGKYGAARRAAKQQYIIGGQDSLPGAWPWQLSFQFYVSGSGTWSHFCGAVLLGARQAITAAHCVDGMGAYQLRVVAGLHDRRQSNTVGIRSAVTSAKMHELYNPDNLYHDIATLGLATNVDDNGFDIGYGKLPPNNGNDFSSTICVLTGWGRIDHNPSSALPNILQQVSIGIITNAQCNSILSSLSGISVTPGMICAYDTLEQKGSCQGDSGGPMHCPSAEGYVVAGVTSWGIGSQNYACYTEFPSVYTRTGSYLSWIANNLP